MERRNLAAGLAALVLGLLMISGTAFAHAAHHKKAEAASRTPRKRAPCSRNRAPFMDQGEFGTSSSVADIVSVECEQVYAENDVTISANELYSRCDK